MFVNRKLITGKDASIYNFDLYNSMHRIYLMRRILDIEHEIERRAVQKIPDAQRFQYEKAKIFFVKTRQQAQKYGFNTT